MAVVDLCHDRQSVMFRRSHSWRDPSPPIVAAGYLRNLVTNRVGLFHSLSSMGNTASEKKVVCES